VAVKTIRAEQLRLYVISPTLERIGWWSESAEELLLGTAAQESGLGRYFHQVNGPALGIYQMEPETHDDVWHNYLRYQEDLAKAVQSFLSPNFTGLEQLTWNLAYSTAVARAQYLRFSEPLPHYLDLSGLAAYWKKYWNSPEGKGRVEEFVVNYGNLVGRK